MLRSPVFLHKKARVKVVYHCGAFSLDHVYVVVGGREFLTAEGDIGGGNGSNHDSRSITPGRELSENKAALTFIIALVPQWHNHL